MAQGNAGGPLPGTAEPGTCTHTILWESRLALSSGPKSIAEAQVTERRAGYGGGRNLWPLVTKGKVGLGLPYLEGG